MEIDLLLSDLGKKLGVDEFKLNESGVASLAFDGKHEVNLEPDADRDLLIMYSPMARWPEGDAERAALAPMLLEANLFGKGTGNAHFSLDGHFGEVMLEQRFNLSRTSADELFTALTKFLNVVDVWHQRLYGEAQADTPDSEPTQDGGWQGVRV